MIWNSRFVLSEPSNYDQFSRSPDINNGVSRQVKTVAMIVKADGAKHQKKV